MLLTTTMGVFSLNTDTTPDECKTYCATLNDKLKQQLSDLQTLYDQLLQENNQLKDRLA
ncbi:hypothetical protein KBB05_02515 [Patescibacteria group bacterium]|nr:hypothetical protein [Patescibacteria group bacterium]